VTSSDRDFLKLLFPQFKNTALHDWCLRQRTPYFPNAAQILLHSSLRFAFFQQLLVPLLSRNFAQF
jgi:hypothetical protein